MCTEVVLAIFCFFYSETLNCIVTLYFEDLKGSSGNESEMRFGFLFDCSQTKFLPNILVLLVFNAIVF